MNIDKPTSSTGNQRFFALKHPQPDETQITEILLSNHPAVCLITHIVDEVTDESVFELACPDSELASQLMTSIIHILPEDLFISIADNKIELTLYCMQLLCQRCAISFDHLIAAVNTTTINTDASSSNIKH